MLNYFAVFMYNSALLFAIMCTHCDYTIKKKQLKRINNVISNKINLKQIKLYIYIYIIVINYLYKTRV